MSHTKPGSAEKNNLEEVAEWVHRDYNNPCVVMWSCGNEVNYENNDLVRDNLNKQVTLVRSLDRSGRPACSFSGMASGFGTGRIDTDMIDLHFYLGMGWPPWTHWDEALTKIFSEQINPTYGEKGTLARPFIIWECVGFQWGGTTDPSFKLNDIDAYTKMVLRPTSKAEPNVIGFSGNIGVAAAADPARSIQYGRNVIGKRITDYIRADIDRIQGFAPWFYDYKTPFATLWTQPVYASLRNTNNISFRNIFDNRTYQARLLVANSHAKDYRNLSVTVTLVDLNETADTIGSARIPVLDHFTRADLSLPLAIPAKKTSGFHQIRVLVTDGAVEISRNYYDVFVQSDTILTAPLVSVKKTALIGEATDKTAALLTAMKVPFTIITDIKNMDHYQAIVVSAASHMHSIFENQDSVPAIKKWVSNGGTLVMLEQEYNGITPLDKYAKKNNNTFVDVIMTAHPVFKGLAQENFDTWENAPYGYIVHYPFCGFSMNALAVRGNDMGKTGVNMAVMEGTLGSGRIFASQLGATELWAIDSAASTFLRNIIEYSLGGAKPFTKTRPWDEAKNEFTMDRSTGEYGFTVASETIEPVNLAPYANQGFADEVAHDQKGGWTDEGDLDLRNMPVGAQTFVGIPFRIIDPAKNNGKSCIVLSNTAKYFFPKKVDRIAVNRNFSRLFFLHTAWYSSGDVGEYRIRYADGSAATVKLVNAQNIGDWWQPGDLPKSLLGLKVTTKYSHEVGLFVMAWENPKPDVTISSIDFESYGVAVPILVAISGEKTLTVKETLAEWNFSAMSSLPATVGSYVLSSSGAKAAFSIDKDETTPLGRGSVKIAVEEPSTRNYPVTDIQLSCVAKLSITEKAKYRLSFWCKATRQVTPTITFIANDSPWKIYTKPGEALFSADTEWKKVIVDVEGTQTVSDKELRAPCFHLGRMPKGTTLWIAGIKFEAR